jgi:sulfur carrier protein
MKNSKYFFLNGQEYFIKSSLTLFEMIEYFNYNSSLLVLEYNSRICKKKDWKNISINNNDKIEIVTIVGGG